MAMYDEDGFEVIGDDEDDDDDVGDNVGDIIGDIIGDDGDTELANLVDSSGDIIGAVRVKRRKRARRVPARRSSLARSTPRTPVSVQRKGVEYTPTQYHDARRMPLGIDSVSTIAAGATSIITVRPQVPYRIDRFVVASAVAGSFIINDIKVGARSQLPSTSAVPAAMFSELATESALELDTAEVAQDITVSVTNTSGGALRFTGGFYGRAVVRLAQREGNERRCTPCAWFSSRLARKWAASTQTECSRLRSMLYTALTCLSCRNTRAPCQSSMSRAYATRGSLRASKTGAMCLQSTRRDLAIAKTSLAGAPRRLRFWKGAPLFRRSGGERCPNGG